jgi:hypothetical protein
MHVSRGGLGSNSLLLSFIRWTMEEKYIKNCMKDQYAQMGP